MGRILALLSVIILAGCQSAARDTIVGRMNGRDIVVTEADIQKRVQERGISRAVALRELRREQETKVAIDLQRKWKSSDDVYVETAKARSRTDQPDSPDEEAIAEQITKEQKRRSDARLAAYAEEDLTDEEEGDGLFSAEEDEELISKLKLPEQRAEFENASHTEGWKTLP